MLKPLIGEKAGGITCAQYDLLISPRTNLVKLMANFKDSIGGIAGLERLQWFSTEYTIKPSAAQLVLEAIGFDLMKECGTQGSVKLDQRQQLLLAALVGDKIKVRGFGI